MKKALAILIVFALAVGLCGAAQCDIVPRPDDLLHDNDYDYYILEDGTAMLDGFYWVSAIQTQKVISLPSEIDGIPVTAIGNRAFSQKYIVELTVPEGVRRIGDGAFQNNSLEEVTLPSTLEEMGDNPFRINSKLKTIRFSEKNGHFTVKNHMLISNSDQRLVWAYQGLEGAVTVPDGIRVIGAGAFHSCSKVTEFKLPGTLTTICDGAFQHCYGVVKDFVIPASVTEIGEAVFFNSLKKLVVRDGKGYYETIPIKVEKGNTVFETADGALIDRENRRLVYFFDCNRQEAYAVPDGIEKIASCAFFTARMNGITLPETVTQIGSEAFRECQWITEMTIPAAVKELPEGAFVNCTHLRKIDLPDGLVTVGIGAFNGCRDLESIHFPDSVTAIGRGCFISCENLKDVKLPPVSVIEANTFSGCKSLESITLPDTVTHIGEYAFRDCTALKEVRLPTGAKVDSLAFTGCGDVSMIGK